MSPRHHPSSDLLLEHAAGSLSSGRRLVIATHAGSCDACAAEVALAEAVGGAMLDDLAVSPLRTDALERAMARIERPVPASAAPPPQRPDWIVVPPEVLEAARRRRRWAAPGVWVAPVQRDPGGDRTYLLRLAPGMSVPRHTHRGEEIVCVLKGAFADGETIHNPGDFVSSATEVHHSPAATRDGECVCLITTHGSLIARDWVGRLFQPIVRI